MSSYSSEYKNRPSDQTRGRLRACHQQEYVTKQATKQGSPVCVFVGKQVAMGPQMTQQQRGTLAEAGSHSQAHVTTQGSFPCYGDVSTERCIVTFITSMTATACPRHVWYRAQPTVTAGMAVLMLYDIVGVCGKKAPALDFQTDKMTRCAISGDRPTNPTRTSVSLHHETGASRRTVDNKQNGQ